MADHWDEYRTYWEAHARNVGMETVITNMNLQQYTDYYRPLFQRIASSVSVETVFDVACGTGMIVPLVRELWPHCRYTGYDIARPMIVYAQAHYPKEQWVLMDGFQLPVRSADLLICTSLFTHLIPTDAPGYLQEILFALRPGGMAVISIHTETNAPVSGGIPRIDYRPAVFEVMLAAAGFEIGGHWDGIQRHYLCWRVPLKNGGLT
jgi:SAM-dependent methyltransferase